MIMFRFSLWKKDPVKISTFNNDGYRKDLFYVNFLPEIVECQNGKTKFKKKILVIFGNLTIVFLTRLKFPHMSRTIICGQFI